jgi:serine/threonine protein phosphatase PrpC
MRLYARDYWRSFSASAIGPAHIQDGRPNQDFVAIRWLKNSVVAVVSDGLGSHNYSDIGSKKSCLAVISAAVQWLKSAEREPSDLLRLIQAFWLMKLRPVSPYEAGATCLFAIAESTGLVTIGRLGDGLIIIDDVRNGLSIMEENKKGFSNQTMALSDGEILKEWEINCFDLKEPESCICIMTDGISEDIDHNKLYVMPELFRELSKKSSQSAQRFLKKELNSWSRPHHTDDKTIASLLRL